MALKITVAAFAITVLLVNANLVSSLELSEPLNRVQRAVSSENPVEDLNSLITETLSPENVQSLIQNLLPSSLESLPDKLANEDLLEGFVKNYVENPNSGLSQLKASGVSDIQSVLATLNSEIGETVLIVGDNSIAIDVDALGRAILAYSKAYIKQAYKGDIFLQIALTETLRQQIQIASSDLKPLLANATIPLDAFSEIISLVTSNRSKRDLGNILLELIRIHIGVILRPIQDRINTVLNNIISVVLSLYTPEKPVNIIVAVVTNFTNTIVLRVAEVVVTVQYNINAFFSNIVNGTTTSVSRRRRDIDLEFERFYHVDQINQEVSHRRMIRSANPVQDLIDAIGGLIFGVTAPLNTLLKSVFVSFLSSQYQAIGQLVTTPLRVLVNWLIDTVLPCSTCSSIV